MVGQANSGDAPTPRCSGRPPALPGVVGDDQGHDRADRGQMRKPAMAITSAAVAVTSAARAG
jgi:hypothetical protein